MLQAKKDGKGPAKAAKASKGYKVPVKTVYKSGYTTTGADADRLPDQGAASTAPGKVGFKVDAARTTQARTSKTSTSPGKAGFKVDAARTTQARTKTTSTAVAAGTAHTSLYGERTILDDPT